MKKILTLGIVLLTVNSLLPAQEITFSETKFNWGTIREPVSYTHLTLPTIA